MSDYFIGEIKIFPYTFAPRNWAYCDGQLLGIGDNTALFSILGTIYGGDGRTTLGLPNLQARSPVGSGSGPSLSSYPLGNYGGYSEVQLSGAHLPKHRHSMYMDDKPGDAQVPASNTMLARDQGNGDVFISYLKTAETAEIDGQPMASNTLGVNGASASLPNRQPYLGMSFYICIDGVYPPRN